MWGGTIANTRARADGVGVGRANTVSQRLISHEGGLSGDRAGGKEMGAALFRQNFPDLKLPF